MIRFGVNVSFDYGFPLNVITSKEATKGGSSKAPTSSKTSHSKKKKESSSTMDSNPSQPLVSTLVDTGMHKEDQQETGGPTSLVVYSTAKVDPRLSAPNDSIPQQQGMDKGTKNTLLDHISAGTDPHVLTDQTKSVSEGLKIVLTQPITGKEASSVPRQVEEEASSTIKLEDLAKLVSNVQPSFKDLELPEGDLVIVDDSDEDKEDGVHTTTNAKTEDTSVPKSLSPRPSQIQELTNQELLAEFLSVPSQVKMVPAKLKTLDALLSLLNKVTNALNQFAQAIASKNTRVTSVPSAGQPSTQPAKGEKNTNQATIS
nr:hypothetical protein [Tanacetum cinerariifolium]